MRPHESTHGSKTQWDAVGLITLALLQLGFFWRAALLRGFLVHSDICYFFEPAKALLHESLRAGRLPLWSPYLFCGYPIAAEGQIAAFYPPSLLLSWLLPSPAAINWLIISHVMLAAVSMYLLARALRASPFGAWLAGFIFSFSGYLFAHLHHVSLICAAAWLPLTVLFIERAWDRSLLPNAAFAALTWAAAALCGHPQTLFLSSLAGVSWILSRILGSVRIREPMVLRRALALTAITFLLGAGLAAVQLLLTADLSALAPHGERGDLAYVTSFSLLPRHLLGLIAPNWQGTPALNTYRGEPYYWEYVIYLGIVPLLLAGVGAASRRGRVLGALAVTALILALAKGNPLYHVLRFVPGFSDFRVPARFVFLFTFAAALLAARGWEAVSRVGLLGRGRRLLICGGLVGALTVLDLLHFDRTLAPLADAEAYRRATPQVVQVLRQDPTWGRALIVPPIRFYADWVPAGGWANNPDGWIEARIYLPADVPQSFGLRIIDGYAGFIDPRHKPFFDQAMSLAFQSGDLRLLSLVGTRYLPVGPGLPPLDLPRAEVPPFTVYRNPAAFPRAFAIGGVVPVQDSVEALLGTMSIAEEGRLQEAAVIQGGLGGLRPTGQAQADLSTEEPRPEHVIIHAKAARDALLVLNERWSRGWCAQVDGRPVPLVEVDTVLMGAPLPAGEHTVEFVYRPRALIIGRAISLASLVLLAVALAVGRRPRPDRAAL